MSRYRQPANKDATRPQPHEPDRDKRQPYSKEGEEYPGGGVIRPTRSTSRTGFACS